MKFAMILFPATFITMLALFFYCNSPEAMRGWTEIQDDGFYACPEGYDWEDGSKLSCVPDEMSEYVVGGKSIGDVPCKMNGMDICELYKAGDGICFSGPEFPLKSWVYVYGYGACLVAMHVPNYRDLDQLDVFYGADHDAAWGYRKEVFVKQITIGDVLQLRHDPAHFPFGDHPGDRGELKRLLDDDPCDLVQKEGLDEDDLFQAISDCNLDEDAFKGSLPWNELTVPSP